MIRTVYGMTKGEFVVIPVRNSPYLRNIGISTRKSNIIFGDVPFNTEKNRDYVTNTPNGNGYLCVTNFSTNFEGDVPILLKGGKSDVFSVFISERYASGTYRHWLNIQDFGVWIGQFPNIYSFLINTGPQAVDTDIIKGDLSQIPDSLESFKIQTVRVINRTTDIFLNISNFSPNSKLKYLNFEKDLSKFFGDLKYLPPMCNYFKLMVTQGGNAISYSGGKVWASSFDTLYLPTALSVFENDNLLIDLNNSVTTAIGEKSITLQGFRTHASDVAVAGLIAKNFTVNCARLTDVLIMQLSSNLLDSSTYSNHATMVGTETHSLGGLQTSTGNYAYITNKTSLDFGTGSLRFGCTVKFNSVTGERGIIGKTVAGDVVGRYGIYMTPGNIVAISQMTGRTFVTLTSATPYNDGNFHTIEVICNRTTGKQTLIIDGILINTTSLTPSSDNLSVNARFMIGAYGNATGNGLLASSEFNGIIKDVFVNKF